MIPKCLFVVLVFYLTTEIIAEEYFSLNENVQDPEIISKFTRPIQECILLNQNDQHLVKQPNGTTGPKPSSIAQLKTEEEENKKVHKPKRESEQEKIKNPRDVSYGQPTNDVTTLSRSKLSFPAEPQSCEDKTKKTGAPKREAEVCILLDESDKDLELIKSTITPKAQPKMDEVKKRKNGESDQESEQSKTSSKVSRGYTSKNPTKPKRASSAKPKKGEEKIRKNGSPKEHVEKNISLDERDQDSEQGETSKTSSHEQTSKSTVRSTRSKQVSPAQSKTKKGKKSKLDAEKYISLDKKTSKAHGYKSKNPTKPKAQQKKGVTQKQDGKKYSSLEKPYKRSKDTTKSDRPKRFTSKQKTKTKKEKTVDRPVKTKSKGSKFGKDKAGRY